MTFMPQMPDAAPTGWGGIYVATPGPDSVPIAVLAGAATVSAPELSAADMACERFTVLGVQICNVTRWQAIGLVEEAIDRRARPATSIVFVNAHTLNLAVSDPAYRDVLNAADFAFADGTGVRWAARLRGVRVRENMVGTDFTPALLQTTTRRRHSYFMLGADAATIPLAAEYARRTFPGWKQVGYHHGYLAGDALNSAAIDAINLARPDVLLVGMGNPIQEQWIHRNLPRLNVSVCLGIGGLFDYWAGNVSRAPRWLRRAGHEWLWRLSQQPHLKARRYLVGNPLYLARVLWERWKQLRF